VAFAVAAALAAPAAAGVRWRELDRGTAVGAPPATLQAVVALDRAATKRFASRLPAAGRTALARLDFGRNAAIAVFGEFGCKDYRVAVTSVARRRSTLVVSLVERPPDPDTMECQAIYPTYRLLAVPKSALAKPHPTRGEARLG
jgi:hypothetical protein